MLKYLLAVVAFLVLLATVLWGFPGVWALLTIVPGFILGATIAHVRRPREAPPVAVAPPVSPVVPPALPSPGGIRPGVVVLGGFFGLVTAGASMVVAWAAAAPPTIVIEAELLVDAAVERVWAEVGDPYRRTAWDLWIADLEPVGKAEPAVGSEYRSILKLERMEVPAMQTVLALEAGRSVTWSIQPQGGSTLENMRESVSLEPRGAQTLVRFRMTYDVPSVLGRVGERIAVRGAVERMSEETLLRLRNVATGVE